MVSLCGDFESLSHAEVLMVTSVGNLDELELFEDAQHVDDILAMIGEVVDS